MVNLAKAAALRTPRWPRALRRSPASWALHRLRSLPQPLCDPTVDASGYEPANDQQPQQQQQTTTAGVPLMLARNAEALQLDRSLRRRRRHRACSRRRGINCSRIPVSIPTRPPGWRCCGCWAPIAHHATFNLTDGGFQHHSQGKFTSTRSRRHGNVQNRWCHLQRDVECLNTTHNALPERERVKRLGPHRVPVAVHRGPCG